VAVVLYNGASSDALKPFERLLPIDPSMVRTWKKVTIPWPEFVQPSWDGDGSTKFDPGRVLGLALAFGAGETKVEGRLWVDDIRFLPAR
jgi:hypothetical protein